MSSVADFATELHLTYVIKIHGRVQGVGFRPFVARVAMEMGLQGEVYNHGSAVRILLQCAPEKLPLFIAELKKRLPALAKISRIEHLEEKRPVHYQNFCISASRNSINIDADIQDYAVCTACLDEFNDPDDRRYRYPLISCTECGPRYAILERFPIDRANTSYRHFQPCEQCEQEYHDPKSRRFHAQNIACPKCGPHITLSHSILLAESVDDIVATCNRILIQGGIIAIKGMGGYRLCCDAENTGAIERLRRFKNRPHKPFALMLPQDHELKTVHHHVWADEEDSHLLMTNARPAVLLARKPNSKLANNIAPGMRHLGIFLPSTAFEHLLLRTFGRPIVATSGNRRGEPIIADEELAKQRLSTVTDAFIHHDLTLQHGLDDSILVGNVFTRFFIRRGRATSPTHYTLPHRLPVPVIALGGESKNTITLAWDNHAVNSQHLGGMSDLDGWRNALHCATRLQRLYGVSARLFLCDAHPLYTAHQWLKKKGLPFETVLHHHAHASALTLEHKIQEPLLVFTWDGTGYGENGELWGGEAFYGKAGNWKRVCRIKPLRLPGGQQAIKDVWRCAASMAWHSDITYSPNNDTRDIVRRMWTQRINSPTTSSMGRLFDGAAAALDLLSSSSYDGQAPMMLEAMSNPSITDALRLPLVVTQDQILEIDWRPLVPLLLDQEENPYYRASVFHNSLAASIAEVTRRLAQNFVFESVGLTGGVFQNRILRENVSNRLLDLNLEVYTSRHIPANDAGLSLGQVTEYAAQYQAKLKGRTNDE
ncbi:MAG: carbamoyltransferase HypF [Gammaproteobacteria bacterium]|nr:carbamoyltransferase HypF [Gammaproteobacteria bacterium]